MLRWLIDLIIIILMKSHLACLKIRNTKKTLDVYRDYFVPWYAYLDVWVGGRAPEQSREPCAFNSAYVRWFRSNFCIQFKRKRRI